ncbi:MAG: terminase large subunit domain-containing protein [Bryobacteraceae bacterium]
MGRVNRQGLCSRQIKYDPLTSQKRFHASTSRFKGFSGPIGSGKSQALCQEAIKLSYVNPGRTGLLGAPTFPMLRDATQSALFEILEGNRIPFEYSKADNILSMRDSGSKILFRAVDEFERLRGTNLAWFGLDELTYTQEAAWLRLEGRLRDPKAKRLCGFAVWTPKGYDWVYRKFVSEPVEGYAAIIAQPYENRHLLEQIPDFYDRLRSSYDANFFSQEVLGCYLNVQGGMVYQPFRREEHVANLERDPGLPLLWALDFNVDPMSSVVAQVKRHKVSVLGEIVIRRATTQQACEEFFRRFGGHEGKVVIYGDASGNTMHTTGFSDYQMVREFFHQHKRMQMTYKVPKANPQIRDRVNLTNSKLRTSEGEIDMLIDRTCTELIKDLEQVSYKADTTQIDKEKDRQRTHLSDALGYLLWEECRPMQQIGYRDKPLFSR